MLQTIALALPFLAPSGATLPSGSVQIDLGRGPVTVQVPAGYDPTSPTPLVLLLHGYGGSGAQQEAYMQFGAFVDSHGFLYATPDGTVNVQGQRFWNGTDACCDFGGTGIDDSGYLRALIDEIKGQFHVDPLRVHLIGHSNGHFMAYRMACDHSDVLASVAGLAGATFDDPDDCAPTDPVHSLHLHGTADSVVLYGGGIFAGVTYPGAVASVNQWVGLNGCDPAPDTSAPPLDLDASIPGPETTVARFASACAPGGAVERWDMIASDHSPFFTPQFAPAVLDWLFAHPKPEVGGAFCTPSTNSSGFESGLVAWGSDALADANLTLVAHNAPRNVFGVFFQGDAQVSSPVGDGSLCAGGTIQRLNPPLSTGNDGEARRRVDFGAAYAAGYVAGVPVHYQFWFRDTAAGGTGFNFSEARTVLWQP